MKTRRILPAWVLLLAAACGSEGTPTDAGSPDAAVADARPADDAAADTDSGAADAGATDSGIGADGGPAGDAAPDYLTTLDSPEEFVSLSRAQSVKYILRVTGATPRAPLMESCYFQNTARFQFHIEFLRTFTELAGLTFQDYETLVLDPMTRIWWGGGLIVVRQRHPISGEPESLAYQIYAENGAVVGLREADIVEVDALLKACVPYAATRLAFQPGDPFQEAFARQIAPSLAQRGIAVLTR